MPGSQSPPTEGPEAGRAEVASGDRPNDGGPPSTEAREAATKHARPQARPQQRREARITRDGRRCKRRSIKRPTHPPNPTTHGPEGSSDVACVAWRPATNHRAATETQASKPAVAATRSRRWARPPHSASA